LLRRELTRLLCQGEKLPPVPAPELLVPHVAGLVGMGSAAQSDMQQVNRVTARNTLKIALEATNAGNPLNFDWEDWLSRFNLTLVKESPSPAVAACQELAPSHLPLARKLFYPALLSFLQDLDPLTVTALFEGLSAAMLASKPFKQMMLTAKEFMSHQAKKFSMQYSNRALAQFAVECHAYAKALRYTELEFARFFDIHGMLSGEPAPRVRVGPDAAQALSLLIDNLQQLEDPQAGIGTLRFVQQHMEAHVVNPSLYEKLGDWASALAVYDSALDHNPDDFAAALGRMRCLAQLGRWAELHELVAFAWPDATSTQRAATARLAARAAVGLQAWGALAAYLPDMPEGEEDKPVYTAMLAVHDHRYKDALAAVAAAREALEPELAALWRESYSRGYHYMVQLQRLTELEEVVLYRQAPSEAARANLRALWQTRLQACAPSGDVWLPLLEVRSLALSKVESLQAWLQYCSLCRKESMVVSDQAFAQRNNRSLAYLVALLGSDPGAATAAAVASVATTATGPMAAAAATAAVSAIPMSFPHVAYQYIKHMALTGSEPVATGHLLELITHLKGLVGPQPPLSAVAAAVIPGTVAAAAAVGNNVASLTALLAKCFNRLGQVQQNALVSVTHTLASSDIAALRAAVIQSFQQVGLFFF
jgi:FKBP12-rapamycin complex-associated protein